MHGGLVFVQVREDGGERLTRVEFLGWRRVFGVHVHDEVGIRRKQSHLARCVAPVGAIGVSLDKFADRKPVGSLWGRNRAVLAHARGPYWASFPTSRIARVSRNALMP